MIIDLTESHFHAMLISTMKKYIILSAIPFTILSSCDYSTPTSYSAPSLPSQQHASTSKHSFTTPSNKNLKPSVRFPARVAFARVNGSHGNSLRLVNERDLETDNHAKIVGSLPNLAGAVNIHSAHLSSNTTNYRELRAAARRLGADIVGVYQFHTSSRTTNGSTLLSVVTLGAAPTNSSKATTTASLTFIDSKTGYIYGVSEQRATSSGLSTSWGEYSTRENATHRANQKAFDKLIKNLPTFWQSITAKGR